MIYFASFLRKQIYTFTNPNGRTSELVWGVASTLGKCPQHYHSNKYNTEYISIVQVLS